MLQAALLMHIIQAMDLVTQKINELSGNSTKTNKTNLFKNAATQWATMLMKAENNDNPQQSILNDIRNTSELYEYVNNRNSQFLLANPNWTSLFPQPLSQDRSVTEPEARCEYQVVLLLGVLAPFSALPFNDQNVINSMNQDVLNGCTKLAQLRKLGKTQGFAKELREATNTIENLCRHLSKSINQDKTPAPNNTYMQSH